MKNNNFVLQSKTSKLEKENISEASTDSDDAINKYDKSLQIFLARILNKSVMASMIYGVSRNKTRGFGSDSDEEFTFEKDDKPKSLRSHFAPSGKQNDIVPKGKTFFKT